MGVTLSSLNIKNSSIRNNYNYGPESLVIIMLTLKEEK